MNEPDDSDTFYRELGRLVYASQVLAGRLIDVICEANPQYLTEAKLRETLAESHSAEDLDQAVTDYQLQSDEPDPEQYNRLAGLTLGQLRAEVDGLGVAPEWISGISAAIGRRNDVLHALPVRHHWRRVGRAGTSVPRSAC